MTNKPKPSGIPEENVVDNPEIENFFQRLPGNFRWPKPSADAIAAAAESILRMGGSSAIAEQLAAAATDSAGQEDACAGCGGTLPSGARFCVWCGLPKDISSGAASAQAPSSAQHHVHHHYHHVMPAQGTAAANSVESEPSAPRGRAPGSKGPAPGGRAEATARQVVQDWAQSCNNRHIDDLVELYSPDATLIRSSVPPVRSLPAIREFLLSMLAAGLGDVEMESLRLEIMGDIAMDIGRCKMLVPVVMGKRREERGKYLVVLARNATGNWKILADCWSSDLPVSAPPPAEATKGK